MEDNTDWRLEVATQYFEGVAFAHRAYRRYPQNSDWDHDHCEFCGAKFMEEDYPDVLHVGYCTLDEYHWICETCFSDFRERFAWQLQDGGNAV